MDVPYPYLYFWLDIFLIITRNVKIPKIFAKRHVVSRSNKIYDKIKRELEKHSVMKKRDRFFFLV